MPFKGTGRKGTYRGNLPHVPEKPAPVRIYDAHGDLVEIRVYGTPTKKKRKGSR